MTPGIEDYTKFDTRTLERKLKSGKITEEEYKKFLDQIPESEEYTVIDDNELKRDAGIIEPENTDSDDDTEQKS